jgi:hypothetical protein
MESDYWFILPVVCMHDSGWYVFVFFVFKVDIKVRKRAFLSIYSDVLRSLNKRKSEYFLKRGPVSRPYLLPMHSNTQLFLDFIVRADEKNLV